MVKWEYSKMIEPTRLPGKHAEPAKLVYLGVSKEEERVENIETVEHTLARLGLEGWELVSHTQVFTVVEQSPAVPVLEVYYLKRQVT